MARLTLTLLLLTICLGAQASALPRAWIHQRIPDTDPPVIAYDPQRYPNIRCVAERVIAETDPALTPRQRAALWSEYNLAVSFEWIEPETGFTYHELSVRPHGPLQHARALLTGRPPAPRELPALVELLNEDPRLGWAAPDALLLEWASYDHEEVRRVSDQLATIDPPHSASFIDGNYRSLTGGLNQWKSLDDAPDPLPDFEYYRLCGVNGAMIEWADPLWDDEDFKARCGLVYGTGQALALEKYRQQGSPAQTQVTVCVADTGVLLSHPDIAGRLHPNSVDANYSNYRIAQPIDRPLPTDELTNREARGTTGMPREAIQGRPASHGTAVAGIVARCTAGFRTYSEEAVRILPISIKSERTYALRLTRVTSPLSAFLKTVACLRQDYPVGEAGKSKKKTTINDGDVRVVSTSASVPKSYFSGREWRVVKPLVEKAGAAILEDLRHNDRLYVFAAGNEGEGEPNMPGHEPFVLAASAVRPFNPERPWIGAPGERVEASNLGEKCVSAPGYGIITSSLYDCPNLAYLPAEELGGDRANFSTPPREFDWTAQTNLFSATSAATPQVAALAALIYTRRPDLRFGQVIELIQRSSENRRVVGEYGAARGLINYDKTLDW